MDGSVHLPNQGAEFHYTPIPAAAMLNNAVTRFASRPCINFLGKSYSYTQIGKLTDRAAAGLQNIGVTKGTKIGLCLPNTPYFVILYYATLKCGATIVNFNPLYTEREIENQAREAGVEIMVSLDVTIIHEKISKLAAKGLFKHVITCSMANALPPLKNALFRLAKKHEIATIPHTAPYTSFETLTRGAPKPTPIPINPLTDIATLQFTGGTTGTPKAAMLTHANITANVQQILAGAPPFTQGREIILGILPLFHVFAMTTVMNLGLSIGAELILIPRLDIKLLMKIIAKRRPTIMPGVPTLFTAISNAAQNTKLTDLSFIKYCISGGAPIATEAAERFEHVSQCQILEGYGLSETSPVVTATPPGHIKRGSVGKPLPGTTIEIRDPENPANILPPGERGEICIRGPQVMAGYYNRPEETNAAFTNGALRTGDIGIIDEDGYLFIIDRIKDLILCGGYNVYPRIIEEAAYLHPDIQDAIAIAIPDKYRGQAPKLFVTLRPNTTTTTTELNEFLKQHLNKIEFPKAIEIRDTLPKTMVGKLSKKELIAEEAALYQQAI